MIVCYGCGKEIRIQRGYYRILKNGRYLCNNCDHEFIYKLVRRYIDISDSVVEEVVNEIRAERPKSGCPEKEQLTKIAEYRSGMYISQSDSQNDLAESFGASYVKLGLNDQE